MSLPGQAATVNPHAPPLPTVRALTGSDPREHLRKAGVALLGEDGVGLLHGLPGLVHARRQAGDGDLPHTGHFIPRGRLRSDARRPPALTPPLHPQGPVSGATGHRKDKGVTR